MLASFATDYNDKNITIKPRLSTRQHFDDFILDNARPEWYRNKHRTITTSFEMPLSWDTPVGQWAAFGEMRQERINSSNLGDHEREIIGLTATYTGNFHQKYFAHVAMHHHYFAAWGWRTWPRIDLSMKVKSDLTLFVSHGSAFRMPSFTDLYYTSPANMGHPDLQFEESKTVEGGIRFISGQMSWVASVFQKSGTNLIDWIRTSNELPWIATNIASIRTRGLDIEWRISPRGTGLNNLSVGYTFITSDKEEQIYESKYALNYIRHHAHLKISHSLFFGVEAGWTLNWRDRINQPSYMLTDLKLQRAIGPWRLFIKASNIFDKHYFEIPGVPRPGRWIEGGLAGTWN
jgi:iron complex outermembrane receptor protein